MLLIYGLFICPFTFKRDAPNQDSILSPCNAFALVRYECSVFFFFFISTKVDTDKGCLITYCSFSANRLRMEQGWCKLCVCEFTCRRNEGRERTDRLQLCSYTRFWRLFCFKKMTKPQPAATRRWAQILAEKGFLAAFLFFKAAKNTENCREEVRQAKHRVWQTRSFSEDP